MIVEVTRLMDRWLQGPMGVGVQLAALSRLTPEGSQDSLPDTPTIYNDIEDECVASKIDPDKVPAIVLYVDSTARAPAGSHQRLMAKRLLLVAAYITRDTPASRASLDGGYVLRATRACFEAFNSERNSGTYRKLNGIRIMSVDSVSQDRVTADVGRSQLWGFCAAELTVVEE